VCSNSDGCDVVTSSFTSPARDRPPDFLGAAEECALRGLILRLEHVVVGERGLVERARRQLAQMHRLAGDQEGGGVSERQQRELGDVDRVLVDSVGHRVVLGVVDPLELFAHVTVELVQARAALEESSEDPVLGQEARALLSGRAG
jgi:hypothetical protein